MTDQPTPEVVIGSRSDGGHVALVHLGSKFRQIFADGMDSLRTQLAAVGTSEFGVEQEASRAFADQTIGQHADAASEAAALKEEINLLREQLGDEQKEADQNLKDAFRSVQENEALTAAVAERDAKIAEMKGLLGDLHGLHNDQQAAVAERDAKIEVMQKQIDDLRAASAGVAAVTKPVAEEAAAQSADNALAEAEVTAVDEAQPGKDA